MKTKYLTMGLLVSFLFTITFSCRQDKTVKALTVVAHKTIYFVGDSVSARDIEVVATYSDNTKSVVGNYTVDPNKFDSEGTTSVTITYTENGVTVTTIYSVDVNSPSSPTPVEPKPLPTFTVTFYPGDNNTTGNMSVQTFTQGETLPLTECAYTHASNGYEFIGWAESENGAPKYGDGETITIDRDIELYALWEFIMLADNEFIYFGQWPQSIKGDEVTVYEDDGHKKVVGLFTYYQGDDDNWYCKAYENAYEDKDHYKYFNGSKVGYGGVTLKWFKVELIKWRLLDNNYNGRKLYVAENGLQTSCIYYDNINPRNFHGQTIAANNWAHSKVRAYLNGIEYFNGNINDMYLGNGFLQTAFTTTASSRILLTETEDCNDKIFLLSYDEVTNSGYFADNSKRLRRPTEFALASGAYIDEAEENGGWYFCRSPHMYLGFVHNVSYDGSTSYIDISNEGGLLVPALCIE